MNARVPNGGGRSFKRPALDDLEPLLALVNDPASIHVRLACKHRDAPERAAELYDRLQEDQNLVIVEGDVIVAFASWQYFQRHAHLNILAVKGTHQRGGLGKDMMRGFRRELERDGASGFSLRAYDDSPWALRFYESLGLQAFRSVADIDRPDSHGHQCLNEGLRHYVAMAAAQGVWPLPDKVLFYGTLHGGGR